MVRGEAVVGFVLWELLINCSFCFWRKESMSFSRGVEGFLVVNVPSVFVFVMKVVGLLCTEEYNCEVV